MGAKSGFALKFLQWFIRGIQFGCSALVLALFSYFLAVASQQNKEIPTWAKAVEGISGISVIYTAFGLLLLCCLAGHPVTAFFAIVLDIAFAGAFIYVAQANRGGASSCQGTVTTVFGTGNANTSLDNLPQYGTICRMQSAVLAVSIVAIIFFILSAIMELVLVRHRRKEQRFGPSPANNYTSGYAKRRGLFGIFGRKNAVPDAEDPNMLPQHATPGDFRQSYATETTAVGNHDNVDHTKYSYDYGNGHTNGHTNGNTFRHDGEVAYPDAGVTSGVTNNNPGYRF